MKILFYTCTKQNVDAFLKFSPLIKCLSLGNDLPYKPKKASLDKPLELNYKFKNLRYGADLIVWTENTDSLSVQYNKAKKYYDQYDAIIFLHDDVFITDAFLIDKLQVAFAQFDVVGLAGGADISLKSYGLWHLMCDPKTFSGAVSHFDNSGKEFVTAFGPFGKRCLLLDGLFLAVYTKTTKNVNWDENVMFHHYDLLFCLEANKLKLKLGTAPIYVTHDSPGLKGFSEEFKKSDAYFKEYFNKY
jgi:hypothetical protein